MNEALQKILRDLYELDPGLKKHEETLIRIIEEIVASRPSTKFDSRFAEKLRERVLQEIQKISKERNTADIKNNLIFMKKFYYMFGGALIAFILTVPIIFQKAPFGSIRQSQKMKDSALEMERLSDSAFGALSLGGEERMAVPKGLGGGSPLTGSGSSSGGAGAQKFTEAAGVSVSSESPLIMPPEYITNYKFVYRGKPVSVSEKKLEVLRRARGKGVDFSALNIPSSEIFGVDLSTFNNTKLQSLSVLEERDLGYNIFVNYEDGSLSISENWMKWGQDCFGPGCPGYMPLSLSDVPEDSKTIAIANSFIKEHKIRVENFGEPEVVNDWRAFAAEEPDISQTYIPEILSVLYPQKIAGKFVYEESGQKTGIMVNVNIRKMKAGGAWNIGAQNYQSSLYEVEEDFNRILKVAERGGIYGYQNDNASKILEIELGAPTLEYMRFWNYQERISEELLLPALVFPVAKNTVPEMSWKKNVIIPVVKEILDSQENIQGKPMPFIEKRVNE